MKRFDFYSGLLIFVSSIIALIIIPYQITGKGILISSDYLVFGPDFFPRVILISSALLSCVLMINTFPTVKKREQVKEFKSENNKNDKTIKWVRITITFLVIMLTPVISTLIGLIGAIAVVTIIVSILVGERSFRTIIFNSLFITIFIYSFFGLLLKLPLPHGILI